MAYMFNTITSPSQKYYTLTILPKMGLCHKVCGPNTTFSLTQLISPFIYFQKLQVLKLTARECNLVHQNSS
jgi:hypothetical protein